MNFLQKSLQIASKRYEIVNTIRFSSFESAVSLKSLYPNSSLRLSSVTPKPNPDGKFDGYIPLDQLQITYSKSSGPGGQNVNKINTKVDVRFHLESATWLSDEIKKKLSEKCHNSITKDGCLIFRSDLTRYQQLNLADCLEKIRSLIRNSTKVQAAPTEETIDRIRKRFEKAARERLLIKKQKSLTKEGRRGTNIEV